MSSSYTAATLTGFAITAAMMTGGAPTGAAVVIMSCIGTGAATAIGAYCRSPLYMSTGEAATTIGACG